MSAWAYFGNLVFRSFHGTLRTLEIGEAIVAVCVHVLSYIFPQKKEEFEVAFLVLVGLLVLTFFFGLFLAAYAFNKELREERDQFQHRLVTESTTHRTELEKVKTSNPQLNLIRHEIELRIAKFRDIENRAAGGPIPAGELYPLEADTWTYLKRYFPQYLHFEDVHRIHDSQGTRDMVSPDEARARCSVRIARLTEILSML